MSKTSEQQPVELDIPDGVSEAEQAIELVRAWIADGALMVTLHSDAFGDRVSDWGRLLGEIAHHIARAATVQGHMSNQDALSAVREGFDAMMSAGQPTLSGKIRGRVNH